jgi:sugar lactone lactonase YvrE
MALLVPFTVIAQAVERQVVHGHLPAAARGLPPVGRLEATNRLILAIGLPLRNQDELASLLRRLNNPASPTYRHYLTPEQFTERFGPTAEDYQSVIAFAKANGLNVTGTQRNRMLVDVNASVADTEQAFHVKFHLYQHPTEPRLFYAPDREPSVDLAIPLLGISGLNNFSRARPHLRATPLTNAQNVVATGGSGPGGTYMGKDFRAAYAPDTSLNGSRQVAGLLQFDGYAASDITYYESLAGLPSVTLSNVLIDGASGQPSGNGDEVEVCLDIENVISMATNLSQVVVYMAPNGSPWEDILNRMANDDVAQQLSCSWYQANRGADAVADQIFQQMAAQGQSFFVASGDDDAYTGLIPFPCDSPYVTQVGGTTLTTAGPQGAWVSETVWNWNNGIGSGGGISTQYPIPLWQTNMNMAANQGSTTMRNTPDVALIADNVYVRADGIDQTAAGTSCAAPLWAGFAALVNQQAAATSKPAVGFFNPAVSTIGSSVNYLTAFHDIDTGDNTSTSSPTNFFAVDGYDLCTGWGTPAGQPLIDALADPDLLSISPTTGFSSTGPVSGPFSVISQNFSLSNLGTNLLAWSLSTTSLWLDVSTNGGSLNPGGSPTMVTVSLTATASNLPVGDYGAAVWFTNLSNGLTQSRHFALNVIDPLQITPASGFIAIGPVGGPFNLTNQSFSLTNLGTAWLNWSLVNTSLWLNASATGGTLTNGKAAATVTLSLNSQAYTDSEGVYPASVGFHDGSNGVGQSRQFILNLGRLPVITAQPTNQTVGAGGTATFSVAVSSSGPSAYQWQINRTNLPDNIITTVAGNGTAGYSGDGGSAVNATLNDPYGVAMDGGGNLFIADTDNNCIREVNSNGNIATVAGNDSPGYLAGGTTTNGGLEELSLNKPSGVAVDGAGNLFIADTDNNCIREVYSNGIVATVAGNGSAGYSGDGTQATNASLNSPSGIAVDAAGHLFIADTENNCIREVYASGIVATVAGNGEAGYSGDGGPATNASFSYPIGVAVDGAGNLFVADLGNNRIRKVGFNGIVTTAAGNGSAGYSGDGGMATGASLSSPSGLVLDGSGNLFIADTYNNRIRKVNGSGIITTVAGDGSAGYSGDGGAATNARLSYPFGVTVDGGGNPFVADMGNNRIRRILSAAPPTLTLYNVTANNAGNYTLIITDAWGSVTSSVATLTVASLPVITSEPQSLTVTNGSRAGFGVLGSGTAPLRYQWQKNGAMLSDGGVLLGSHTTNLTLSSATITNAGNYRAVVTNAWGSVTSSVAVLTVISAPVISQQPTNRTVVAGGASSFSVTVSGTPPLAYHWQQDGTNLSNGGEVTGAATNKLVLSSTTTNNAGAYTVIITNTWGSVTSSVATLVVVLPPKITDQPNSVAVTNGSPAGFSILATGTAPLSYQWQKNGVRLSDGGTLSGSQSTNLVLSAATILDVGNYEAIVTNAWGSVTSSTAMLTVVSAPVITQQPTNQTTATGGVARFSVAALGTSPLGYQWQENGTNLSDAGEIKGSGTNTLVVSSTTTNNAGSYQVIIANGWGSVTSSLATLTVVLPPSITRQPQSLTVTNGGPAGFSVAAAGLGPLGYQWQRNGIDLSDGGTVSGSRTTNLVLSAATINDAGNYRVMVSNAWSSVASSVAILKVISPPVIVQQPTNQTAVAGTAVSFSVPVLGTTPLFCQWRQNGTNLNDHGDVTGSATTNLMLSPTTTNNAGNYTLIITNAWGGITSSIATLTVVAAPRITLQPQSLTVTNGSPASFNLLATGTAPLGCQWQRNGVNVSDGTNEINLGVGGGPSGSSTPSLLLSSATIADAGNYRAIVTNAWGAVTSSVAILTVISAPAIAQQPTNQIVLAGGTANFSVAALGTPPLAYQWLFNGTNLAGATNTTLILSNVHPLQAGIYTVLVTNLFGFDLSSNAVLTVVQNHFAWGQIRSPQFVNTPFSVTIQNQNPTNGVLTNFTGVTFLDTTNGLAVAPARSGNFVQGSWTGSVVIAQTGTNLVLRARDALGNFGLANPINVVALPSLDLQLSGNTLLFLWPIDYSGFVLEKSGNLSAAAWTAVPASPVVVGNQYFVPLQISATNSFYRLILPAP